MATACLALRRVEGRIDGRLDGGKKSISVILAVVHQLTQNGKNRPIKTFRNTIRLRAERRHIQLLCETG